MPDPGHSNRNAKIIKTWPLLLREGKEIQRIAIMEHRGTVHSAVKERRFT